MGKLPVEHIGESGTIGTSIPIGTITVNGTTYTKYRKIVDFGQLPNAAEKSVNAGLGSYNKILALYGFANASWGGGMPLPYASTALVNNVQLVIGATGDIVIQSARDTTMYSALVTIEYY